NDQCEKKYGNLPASDGMTQMVKPMSMWQWFGLFFLISIPCIGWIAAIVFACSSTGSINRRNFARAYCLVFPFLFLVSRVIEVLLKIFASSLRF
ncbi:MAG: hypothetical protein ACRC37_03355, partial [Lentisphaeria bacterium]